MYLAQNQDVFLENDLIPIACTIDNEVPLVFPVIAKSSEIRDSVRKHLIDNDIYCPVHWPLPNNMGFDCKALDYSKRELSIVCDQRYDLVDMQRIIDVMKEYKPNGDRSY